MLTFQRLGNCIGVEMLTIKPLSLLATILFELFLRGSETQFHGLILK